MKGSLKSKEERRRQLLTVAITCFGARGYHATQISHIIENANVARGTFYLYFKSKREIFDAVMTELFTLVQAEIRALPRDAVMEIPAQLMGNIERVLRLLMGRPELLRILMTESIGLDDELDERLRDFYGRILDYIRRGLAQGQQMGFVRKGNISVLSVSLLGIVKEVLYQHVLKTEELKLEEAASEMFKTVVGAIASPQFSSQIQNIL